MQDRPSNGQRVVSLCFHQGSSQVLSLLSSASVRSKQLAADPEKLREALLRDQEKQLVKAKVALRPSDAAQSESVAWLKSRPSTTRAKSARTGISSLQFSTSTVRGGSITQARLDHVQTLQKSTS